MTWKEREKADWLGFGESEEQHCGARFSFGLICCRLGAGEIRNNNGCGLKKCPK